MIDIEPNFSLTDTSSSFCVDFDHNGNFENLTVQLPIIDPETSIREVAVDFITVLYDSGQEYHSSHGYRSNATFEVVIPELDGFYDKFGNTNNTFQVISALNATGMNVYSPGSPKLLLVGHSGPTHVLKWHRLKEGVTVLNINLYDTRYWPDYTVSPTRQQITDKGIHFRCLLRVREL